MSFEMTNPGDGVTLTKTRYFVGFEKVGWEEVCAKQYVLMLENMNACPQAHEWIGTRLLRIESDIVAEFNKYLTDESMDKLSDDLEKK